MTRIFAAALCCLLLAACGTADWLSQRQRDRQDRGLQSILEYQERQK